MRMLQQNELDMDVKTSSKASITWVYPVNYARHFRKG